MNAIPRISPLSRACFRGPVTVSLAALAGAVLLHAGDWPQYRGPHHDGISTEKIASKWPANGPKQLWKAPTSDGFSSITVAGGKAFTLITRQVDGTPREVCLALDAATGKELWFVPVGVPKWEGGGDSGTDDNKGGDGPRSTPTVDGDKVYALAANLVLTCMEAATGKTLWTVDIVKDHAGQNITWKNAASPVIEGNLIFVAGGGPGQALMGINKTDGTVVWKGQDDKMTHATPTIATISGERQVIFFTQKGLVSVKPADGSVLWRHPFKYNVSTAASPVVSGDMVYCAAGYGVGSTAVRIAKDGDKFTATELWRKTGNQPVANHWSTPVQHDGYLYGMFGFKEYGTCPLKCVSLATGEVKWEQAGFGAGNVTLADGRLLALADNGDLVLVDATPEAYKELSRTKAVAGKCWSTPSVSNGKAYVRSTKEAVCLDISGGVAQR
ncbi:MAG TPA: PQQ-binding-like beta-propeller repeat protein [Verrucomicrobiae bacterium]|nr:PQQ-binding-like beta-propeller repeat protein [Verrucomicrobiae bacterium]